jgi:hypothetical protein
MQDVVGWISCPCQATCSLMPSRHTTSFSLPVSLPGFGLPCTLPTLLLPFHTGCALLNMLFPVFILVACASDPGAKHGARSQWDFVRLQEAVPRAC